MFLKTIPPVVAVHSEWRSGKSLSLPICFNDSASDSDFVSSSGTPIPHKVQMIIDSLCSTQSSDMSNDDNSSAQSALNLPKSACGGHKSCHMDTLTRSRRAVTDSCKLQMSGSDATEGSDSDDSVDRGIEEAIQEYLKEKVDHKLKREPVENSVPTPKFQPGVNCISDAPKQLMHSTKVLTNSNHSLKGSKGIQPLVALKKKKKSVKENPFEKASAAKTLSTKAPPASCLPQVDCAPPSLRINVKEDDLMDSSSDDGIEEAIQKFQQEEKERHEGLRYCQLKEMLDTSSDDGIEEAIRNYQQERQKEKDHKIHTKPTCLDDHIHVKPVKKISKKKSRKKNAIDPKEMKCALQKPVPVGLPLSMLPACCLRAGGDALCSTTDGEPQDGRQIHSTFTVNTTAELMCAEAILDISKTVMPAVFEPTLDLSSTPKAETPSFLPTAVSLQKCVKSDESSVDSEDGIEQEIRKFLELKAKLHEQASTTDYSEVPTVTKATQHIKVVEDQNKALRLSFSRKRKWKEVVSKSCKQGFAVTLKEEAKPMALTQSDFPSVTWCTVSPNTVKNCYPASQSSPHHCITEGSTSTDKGSSCGTSPPKSVAVSERNYSSDKSSSLDSDEDLDAAIKDLLKTKKKVKKKVRDMKLKARRSSKPVLQQSTESLKKPKIAKDQKLVLAAKPTKLNTIKSTKGLISISRQDKGANPKGLKSQNTKTPIVPVKEDQGSGYKLTVHGVQSSHVEDDSSSVDSDDSIEQEIRRFLAEKAKVSFPPETITKQENADSAVEASCGTSGEKDIKEEVRMEKLQTMSSELTRASLSSEPNPEEQTGTARSIKGPATSFASRRSSEEGRTGDQLRDRTLHDCKSIGLDKDQAEKLTGKFTERTSSEPFISLTSPQESKAEVRHENLFLMKHDNCSINTARDISTDLSCSLQSRGRLPLVEVISTVPPSPPPLGKQVLSSPSETLVVAKTECKKESSSSSRSDSFDLPSWERKEQWDQPHNLTSNTRHTSSKPAHLSRHQPSYPSHLSCVPLPLALSQPRAGHSMRRDQSSVIALPSHKSTPLQLKHAQKDTRKTSEVKEEQQERCIDETDVDSGEEMTDKRQHQCSQ